jgi:hypothetical protein
VQRADRAEVDSGLDRPGFGAIAIAAPRAVRSIFKRSIAARSSCRTGKSISIDCTAGSGALFEICTVVSRARRHPPAAQAR